MRLCGYTRRSTDRQAVSPQAQEREIRDWCAAQGHELVRVYHEVPISASKKSIEQRTVLPALLSEVKNKKRDFDGIIVWKFDRAFRQEDEYHIIAAILRKHNCRLLSVKDPISDSDTAAARLTASIFMAIAAYEAGIIGERVFGYHMTVFLSGKWPGGNVPIGFTYDKDAKVLVPNERVAGFESTHPMNYPYGSSLQWTSSRNPSKSPVFPRTVGLWSSANTYSCA